jgi:hypothetical protein
MSARRQEKSGVVSGAVVESKRGAAILVERVQLTPKGVSALTTTAVSISTGAERSGVALPESTKVPEGQQ